MRYILVLVAVLIVGCSQQSDVSLKIDITKLKFENPTAGSIPSMELEDSTSENAESVEYTFNDRLGMYSSNKGNYERDLRMYQGMFERDPEGFKEKLKILPKTRDEIELPPQSTDESQGPVYHNSVRSEYYVYYTGFNEEDYIDPLVVGLAFGDTTYVTKEILENRAKSDFNYYYLKAAVYGNSEFLNLFIQNIVAQDEYQEDDLLMLGLKLEPKYLVSIINDIKTRNPDLNLENCIDILIEYVKTDKLSMDDFSMITKKYFENSKNLSQLYIDQITRENFKFLFDFCVNTNSKIILDQSIFDLFKKDWQKLKNIVYIYIENNSLSIPSEMTYQVIDFFSKDDKPLIALLVKNNGIRIFTEENLIPSVINKNLWLSQYIVYNKIDLINLTGKSKSLIEFSKENEFQDLITWLNPAILNE